MDVPLRPRSPYPPPPEIEEYFLSAVPADWFSEVLVDADKDEILVTGTLIPDGDPGAADFDHRCLAHISEFRESSRPERVQIASAAEERFDRKVSWAVYCGHEYQHFTRLAVPAMTRLTFSERAVLDILIAGGVARSRSEALSWCVQVISTKHFDWIEEMVAAVSAMERIRRSGPAGQ